ncbi:hypothetical protein Tco_1544254, partial [Tanacetum coccineum]
HHRQGRRFAARGNRHDERDPRDVEIERLRQRVRELEIQHEIRQIRKRIRELELTGDEEYLTNGDSIYDSQPVYDEYADEEWYSLFIRGDRNLSGEMLVEGGDRLGGDGIGVATFDWALFPFLF